MSEQRESISYRHYYTPEELKDKGNELANTNMKLLELEDDKKAVTSEFAAKINATKGSLNLLSRQVYDGYETKTILAIKRKNFADRVWEFVNQEGEIIKTEPLTGRDLQYDVPLATEDQPGGKGDEVIEGEDLDNGVEPDDTQYHTAHLLGGGDFTDGPKLLGSGDPDDEVTPGPKKRGRKPKKPK